MKDSLDHLLALEARFLRCQVSIDLVKSLEDCRRPLTALLKVGRALVAVFRILGSLSSKKTLASLTVSNGALTWLLC